MAPINGAKVVVKKVAIRGSYSHANEVLIVNMYIGIRWVIIVKGYYVTRWLIVRGVIPSNKGGHISPPRVASILGINVAIVVNYGVIFPIMDA